MAICELNHIHKSFGDKVIFEDYSLRVNHGDFLCISGNSGAGKSTLLNIMGLLERPDSGTVHVFGEQDVKPNTRTANKMLRHKIGFLFQNFGLIDDKSVSYNLDIDCVKKKRWDKNKKRQLLEKLQLYV
jgi:putative ABC transport system ATP-binding protein